MLPVSALAAALTALTWALSACSSGTESPGIHTENEVFGPQDRGTAYALPCTDGHDPANFTYYSLGPRFRGLPLTSILRECGPLPKSPDGARENEVTFTYGTCEASFDAGCASPIEVQSWPACERTASDLGVTQRDLRIVRGAPAANPNGRDSIEIYTGTSTVLVFGDGSARGRKLIGKAIPELRAVPPTEAPLEVKLTSSGAPRGDLPPPTPGALRGKLPCEDRRRR